MADEPKPGNGRHSANAGHANLRPAQPGEVRNPAGINQFTYRREFEREIDRLLNEAVPDPDNPKAKLSRGALMARLMVQRAIDGDDKFGRDVLARVWPQVTKHELGDGAPTPTKLVIEFEKPKAKEAESGNDG